MTNFAAASCNMFEQQTMGDGIGEGGRKLKEKCEEKPYPIKEENLLFSHLYTLFSPSEEKERLSGEAIFFSIEVKGCFSRGRGTL